MSRTLLNPSIQITNSTAYSSTATAGSTLQTGALTIEDDLNAIRAQLSRVNDPTMAGNWYDDVYATADGKKRGLRQLNDGLAAIEDKSVLDSVSVTTAITVPQGQNYVILSVAGSETPTQAAAVAAGSLGAVVALSAYSGAAFAANELAQLTGSDAESPKNRAVVVDATTKNVIETGDNDIFGLLQLESTTGDGATFNDTTGGARLKLSFVYFDAASNSMVPCPAADIAGKQVRYTYNTRYSFANLPEDAFVRSGYVDQVAAVDVTLTRAAINQAGAGIPVNTDVLWRVANGTNFKVQNSSGSKDLLAISPTASGNGAQVSTDSFAFNTTAPITSVKGASIATAAQGINLGVTTGQIDTTGPLAIKALGSNALALSGGSSLTFTDSYEAASNWVSGAVPLTASTTEWNSYRSAYGEASLFSAIVKAGQMGSHGVKTATVTAATIPANTIVTGNGSGANISAVMGDYSATPNPQSNVLVFLNGILMSPGTGPGTTEDYYLTGDATRGELAFTFALKGGSQPDKLRIQYFQTPADNF